MPFTEFGDLLSILDGLGVARAVLAGHSGGGATAASLAVVHPGRVCALILLAPGFDGYPWPPDDPFFTELSALEEAGDFDGVIALTLCPVSRYVVAWFNTHWEGCSGRKGCHQTREFARAGPKYFGRRSAKTIGST